VPGIQPKLVQRAILSQLDKEHVPVTVSADLHAFITDPSFPCLGAKGALRQGGCLVQVYESLGSTDNSAKLGKDLASFIAHVETNTKGLTAFAAAFPDWIPDTEEEFEAAMWRELQSLHEHDQRRDEWAADASDDPEDAEFAFSFASTSFFIIGLHPNSSRIARRFRFPTLVFNPRSQLNDLRHDGKFESMKKAIRRRDVELQGSLNPNLADFGESSEARQYSGREVQSEWKCPFHHVKK
jgi:FPC/CPF motif-containing protein YcgG